VLKISYAGCLDLSPVILSQFTVEMYAAANNCEKFTKNPYFGVQGHQCWVLTNLKSPSPVPVMISSMFMPICNRFHTIRANIGKITSIQGVPLFDALVQREPSHPRARNCHDKLESLGQPTVKISWS